MNLRRWESVVLLESPGSIKKHGIPVIESHIVVGIEPAAGTSYYHHRLTEIGIAENITRTAIDLPAIKARKLCELFRRLYSDERTPPAEFDCQAGLDFLIGASDEVAHTVRAYDVRGPMRPDALKPGEPYMILAGNTVHDFLAADSATGLHIAGPGGGLGHTPAADLMRVWEGTLQQIIGWEV